jgi:hypothetical protein
VRLVSVAIPSSVASGVRWILSVAVSVDVHRPDAQSDAQLPICSLPAAQLPSWYSLQKNPLSSLLPVMPTVCRPSWSAPLRGASPQCLVHWACGNRCRSGGEWLRAHSISVKLDLAAAWNYHVDSYTNAGKTEPVVREWRQSVPLLATTAPHAASAGVSTDTSNTPNRALAQFRVLKKISPYRHKVTMSMSALKLTPQPEFCEILRSVWCNRYLLDKAGRNAITPTPTPSPSLKPQFGIQTRDKRQFLVLSPLSGGRIGHTELQAQTHQKSVSWNVPEVGLAHDPGPGNYVRFYYILTSTCEPHRFFNRRDNAWARVFFLARLGLKSTV